MIWHRLSENPQAIDHLYGEATPSLHGCTLTNLQLDDKGGGRLTLIIQVTQMPEEQKRPRRWWDGSNRVSIELAFSGLTTVTVEGWSVNNVVDVGLQRAQDGKCVELIVLGPCRLKALAHTFRIVSLQGYRSE